MLLHDHHLRIFGRICQIRGDSMDSYDRCRRILPVRSGLILQQPCSNRYGSEWFVLFGETCCGLGAGLFWMAEGAIALLYPEISNKGRFLGTWLTFRVLGQVMGGAVNLGLNIDRDEAGAVSYGVYQVFIALQTCAPFVGRLVSSPSDVERSDGTKVSCSIPRDQSKSQTRIEVRLRALALFRTSSVLACKPN